jgi:hypothetical protein
MKSLVTRMKGFLRWAAVSLASDDSGNYPVIQVRYFRKAANALQWTPYGLHCNAPVDTLVQMFTAGNSEARVAFPGSPVGRPVLAVGEVVLYQPTTGASVLLKANGDIEVSPADGGEVKIPASAVDGVMNEAARAVLETHTHGGGSAMDQALTAGTHTTTTLKGD